MFNNRFKQKVISAIVGLCLLATVMGATGIIGDAFGLAITPSISACESAGSGSGGGC